MKAQAYDTMRAVEDGHWWFDGMDAIAAHLLGDESHERRLDAGCGTGRGLGDAAGVDHSLVALKHCAARGCQRLALANVCALPFGDGAFDLVTSFDVLTAVPDDLAALSEMHRVLRPGGRLLVRVAAHPWLLGGHHDREWDMLRRYSRRELRQKLAAAGFAVERLRYAGLWIFPLALIQRLLPDDRPSDLRAGWPFSAVLRWSILSEMRLPAPIGLSLFALARKTGFR